MLKHEYHKQKFLEGIHIRTFQELTNRLQKFNLHIYIDTYQDSQQTCAIAVKEQRHAKS